MKSVELVIWEISEISEIFLNKNKILRNKIRAHKKQKKTQDAVAQGTRQRCRILNSRIEHELIFKRL